MTPKVHHVNENNTKPSRKFLHIIYLTKELYLEDMKNTYSSTIRNNPIVSRVKYLNKALH